MLQARQIQAVKIPVPLHIGFEDEAILVVWKPAGLHTSGNHQTSLRAQVATWATSGVLADSLGHPEPAHRLDFATSGWVIFGRTAKALQELNAAFKNERIKKHYLAIVHGTVPAALKIHLSLESKSASTAALCWATGGIPTRGEGSLICITTGSGRTHQIRKHLYAIQHGIVGDDRYGNGPHYAGHGLLLTAYRLEFTTSQSRIKWSRLRLLHPESSSALRVGQTCARDSRSSTLTLGRLMKSAFHDF